MLVLFLFNPAHYGFYPFCIFHKLTGLDCPGCGGLRALHQLTHGQILEAMRLNALLVLSLPVVAILAARFWWLQRQGRAASATGIRPVWIWLLLAMIIAFGILRNLPLVTNGLH